MEFQDLEKKSKKKLTWLWVIIAVAVVAGIATWCVLSAMEAKGIISAIKLDEKTAFLIGLFVVCALGYLLGRITIKGVSLETSGVFLVAILFGFLCTLINPETTLLGEFYLDKSSNMLKWYKDVVSNLGLVLFVGAVGFIAGPTFFRNLKKNAKSFVLLGGVIIIVGAVVAILFALIPGIESEFSAGVLSGALTSTPGYSAALKASGENPLVTLGYAVAYPFGVVGVVLFVQLMPKILKVDMDKERSLLSFDAKQILKKKAGLIEVDSFGLMPFAVALVCGILVGLINIPLTADGYSGAKFSLGNTGGVLILCLIFGHFGRVGKISFQVPERTLKVIREFGLMLFLLGSGVDGGVQLVSQIQAQGGMIVVWGLLAGVVMTILPMLVGYIFATKVLKMPLLAGLGSITGGMTSTPALGTLISTAKTDDVASAYASTYPIALILIVLAGQLITTLL